MAVPGDQWSHTVISSREAAGDLFDEWASLFTRSVEPCPFVAPSWLLAWWDSFAVPEWEMRLLAVRVNERLVAIAPFYLVEDRILNFRVQSLRFWEDPHSNRVFPLLDQAEAAPATERLVECLLSDPALQCDLARLASLPLDHPATDILRETLGRKGVAHGIDSGFESPYRRLPSTWALFEATLSRSFRRTLKRRVNAAHREGFTLEISGDRSSVDEVLELSGKTWQHANGTGIGSLPEVRAFYTRVMETAERSGQLQVATLRVDQGPLIAFELNLEDDQTVYNLKVGYDPAYRSCSPGLVLREFVLRNTIASGKVEFDFLGEAEDYKLHWTDAVRPHGHITLWRSGAVGWLYVWAKFRFKPWLRERTPWVFWIKRRLQR